MRYLFPIINYSSENIPVKPKDSKWNISKKSADITYTFKKRRVKELFVFEMLKYCRDIDCEIKLVIEKNKVKVIVKSLSPSMSEIEFECIDDIKKIKKDVIYYKKKA